MPHCILINLIHPIWLFSTVSRTIKRKYFQWIQAIKAATIMQVKTLTKEDLHTASGSSKNDGISMFENRVEF